jgi:hypothetical protein
MQKYIIAATPAKNIVHKKFTFAFKRSHAAQQSV